MAPHATLRGYALTFHTNEHSANHVNSSWNGWILGITWCPHPKSYFNTEVLFTPQIFETTRVCVTEFPSLNKGRDCYWLPSSPCSKF